MKKLLRGMILSVVVLTSLQMDVFATETVDPTITGTVVTGGIDMNASIMMIKDPYEQCLAYTKYKKITNIDCKKKAEEIKQKKEEQKTEINDEERNASKRPMPIYDDKGEKKKNNTDELIKEKNKPTPPYLDRAKLLDNIYENALSQSKVELSSEEKSKIIQTLRESLTSAILNGAFDEMKYKKIDEMKEMNLEVRNEVKDIRQETKKEIKEIRTTQKSDIKSKQEAMRKLLKEKKEAMKNKIPTQTNTNQ